MMFFNTTSLTAIFLIAIRLGPVFLFSPIEAIRVLPIHIRLFFLLIVSNLIVVNVTATWITTDLNLGLSVLTEFCNGLFLALGVYAAFSIFHIAGQLIDSQMGLNAMAIFNPVDHTQDPFASRLLLMLAVWYFFTAGGHHQLLYGLMMSFKLHPPGEQLFFNHFSAVIDQFGLMFVLSIMIASPIVFGLLILDILAGILNRNMPQLSPYFLILPVKIIIGLLLLIFMLSVINPMMEKMIALCFQCWPRMLP